MALTTAKLDQAVSAGMTTLRAALVRRPPAGMTSEQASTAFSRLERPIAGALRAMLEKFVDAVPCSICRKRRGTNLSGCDRCRSFELMRLEKESPAFRAGMAKVHEELIQRREKEAALDETRLADLRGRTIRVALVGCGSQKAPSAREARNLYTGALFRQARRYAEHHCDDWVILSAKHGVVLPEQVIAPYDASLRSMRLQEREDWARRVSSLLRNRFRTLDVEYVGLAGEEYLSRLDIGKVQEPLERLRLGERISRLKAMNQK